MNIACNGNFLAEGLKEIGCNVLKIAPAPGDSIAEAVGRLGEPVDLVILEIMGNFLPACKLGSRLCETVAYCVDSPINEYWIREYCRGFDFVFVDQKATVDSFARHGIKSEWLPLCAQRNYFSEAAQKEYDIAFIGTVNEERRKRKNLLEMLRKHFRIHIAQTSSLTETRDIFARSKIVLNENLFPGLTLRVFQGLAAGSLVFTEADAHAYGDFFRDGEELVFFEPENILDRLGDALANYENYARVADAGREACANSHTSRSRAETLLNSIKHGANRNAPPDSQAWHWALAKYRHTRRYGGDLREVMAAFQKLATTGAEQALVEIGNIRARCGDAAKAGDAYLASLDVRDNPEAWIKIGLLNLAAGDLDTAELALERAAAYFPRLEPCAALVEDRTAALFCLAAAMRRQSGAVFDPGFLKLDSDPVPDAAFDILHLAWERRPSGRIAAAMLACLEPFGMAAELLPLLASAAEAGILAPREILRGAELAAGYYDPETAAKMMKLFRQKR